MDKRRDTRFSMVGRRVSSDSESNYDPSEDDESVSLSSAERGGLRILVVQQRRARRVCLEPCSPNVKRATITARDEAFSDR